MPRASSTSAHAREALAGLYTSSSPAKELGAKARGILVFPRIIQGGAGDRSSDLRCGSHPHTR